MGIVPSITDRSLASPASKFCDRARAVRVSLVAVAGRPRVAMARGVPAPPARRGVVRGSSV